MSSREYRRAESVLVVVYTLKGEALVMLRRAPFHFWQSVTGSLHQDESPGDAAARELFEETGIKRGGRMHRTGVSRTFVIDPRWRDRFAPGTAQNLEHEFLYELPDRVAISLSSEEHSEMEWLPIPAAIDRVWSWTNRAALRSLHERKFS